jgi:hypothetical protein
MPGNQHEGTPKMSRVTTDIPVLGEPSRIQDGSIHDATDFWQLIMDTSYIIEGENRGVERKTLHQLKAWLDEFFAANGDITFDGPLDHFAMHAVRRLVGAFAFNDKIGADQPEFPTRMLDRVAVAVGVPPGNHQEH